MQLDCLAQRLYIEESKVKEHKVDKRDSSKREFCDLCSRNKWPFGKQYITRGRATITLVLTSDSLVALQFLPYSP